MVLETSEVDMGIDRKQITDNKLSKDNASKKPTKPLSFSISRILDGADDKRTCSSNVTSHTLSSSMASRVADDNPRVPKLHVATVHHYAPVTENDGYSHFESQVQPRACSTPENEYPSPTPGLYPPSYRYLPGKYISGNYPSENYTSPAMTMFQYPSAYVAERIAHAPHSATKRDVTKSQDCEAHADYADDDDVGVDVCERTEALDHPYDVSPSSETDGHISEHHSDKSLDSLGESYHQSPSPFKAKKKKTRTVFSRTQVYRLEAAFELKRYLSSAERSGLAASLNLSETQIKIWFQNRRNKWKRQINGEMDEIPIPPAFAAGYLQSTYGQPSNYGHVMDAHARGELLRSTMSLPAYYAHPYGREKLHQPYLA